MNIYTELENYTAIYLYICEVNLLHFQCLLSNLNISQQTLCTFSFTFHQVTLELLIRKIFGVIPKHFHCQ